ncbi:aminoglycoside phosphotransferase family protein [Sedimenticola sp.]|uniref:aminoglycoside phosphotransferase family protein n=1 Tax=Sedimenticola sp. TaxID=1940285 RepID=UPI003D14ED24
MDQRLEALTLWVSKILGTVDGAVVPASADASFRRYFRVKSADGTFVVMDAPPDKEDCGPFLAVADLLRNAQVHVPRIFASDLQQGFLLLEDLGSQSYLQTLTQGSVAGLYRDALATVVRMQSQVKARAATIPEYDITLLRQEMALFTDWLLGRHLNLDLAGADVSMLDGAFDLMVNNALAQPQVFVHRDFHSRNLMVVPTENPGVIDFQDAVIGPITYDPVSLLKDCYISWPRSQVIEWLKEFRQSASEMGLDVGPSEHQFISWFDRMGVQRHLKAAGIFARLWHRDGKNSYLADIPRTLGYIVEVGALDEEVAPLAKLISEEVLPRVQEINDTQFQVG